MVESIEVYEVGTEVVLSDGVDAKIVTVAIHAGNMVQYECSWWSSKTRTRDWFTVEDFKEIGKKDKPTKIGFLRTTNSEQ
jgi:hypothetical protein